MELPSIGCHQDELDTPALCIDLDAMEFNISAMVAGCRRHGLAWRPHAKCHKSSVIARKLVEAGAIGVTCAKLGEAEVMAAGGVRDLLIANLLIGPQKLRRLVELRRVADPIVCVDHPDQVQAIGSAMAAANLSVRVLVEVDIGLERVGVAPGRSAVELARLVHRTPGLRLAGLMGYEGHLLQLTDPQEKRARIHESVGQLVATRAMLEESELPCEIVSCGGTGSYRFTAEVPGITELQAGGAIFMDVFYREACGLQDLPFALKLLATVVSRPTKDRAVVDAGRKTLNGEIYHPVVANCPGVRVSRMSAEHLQLQLDDSAADLRIGERVELIPGYADLTTVLHDQFYALRGGRLEAIWPVEARGAAQ